MNTIGISANQIEYLTFHRSPPDVTLMARDDAGRRILITFHQENDLQTLRFLKTLVQESAKRLAIAMEGPTADRSGSAYEPQHPDHSRQLIEDWETVWPPPTPADQAALIPDVPEHICGTILTRSEVEQAREEGWQGGAA